MEKRRWVPQQLPQGEHLKDRPGNEQRVVLRMDLDGNYYLNQQPIRREDALGLPSSRPGPRTRVLHMRRASWPRKPWVEPLIVVNGSSSSAD